MKLKDIFYILIFCFLTVGCFNSTAEVTKTSIEIPWHQDQKKFGFEIIHANLNIEYKELERIDRDVFVKCKLDYSKSFGVVVNDRSIKKVELLKTQEGVLFTKFQGKINSSKKVDKIELENETWYKLTNFDSMLTYFVYFDELGKSHIHSVNLHNNW